MGSGQPRKLSDEEAAAMSRGEEAGASVARFLAGEEGRTIVLDTVPYEG